MIHPWQTPAYLIPPLVASSISLVLLVVIIHHDYRSAASRTFSLLLFTLSLWGVVIFNMRSSPDIAHALRWDRAVNPLAIAMGVFYLHFALIVTRTYRLRNLLKISYAVLALSIALAPTGFLISRMEIQAYGYSPVFAPGGYLVFVVGYFMLITAVFVLARSHRKATTYEEKNRLLYLSLAMIFPLLGGVFEAFPIIYPTSIFGNMIFCLLASVAVLRYHLFDVRVVIRKGVAYLLTSTLVAIPYVLVILLFTRILRTGPLSAWTYMLLVVVLALGLQPLWSQAQRRVDRWFYRWRYDFLKELEDFGQEAHDISNLNQLCSLLVRLVSRAVQSSGVYLLLSSETGNFATECFAGEVPSQLSIESRSPLLQWFRTHDGILHIGDLDTIPQFQSLTGKETDEFKRIRAELFMPVKTKQKELVGMLILAQKLSEQPYSNEDERLVLSAVTRAAVELENARLYDAEKTMRKGLETQDELKTEFLHSVAHELKTPLTAILSSSELLGEELADVGGPGDRLETGNVSGRLVNNIRRSAQSMERRVTELLNLAKIQIGELDIEPEPLEIGSLITDVVSQLRILFENKQQTLTLDMSDSLSKVKADRGKLEQVLSNLLSNANEFSPTGSKVILRAREVDSRILVEVEDSAPAITEEEKNRLFNPYYRGEDADKRRRFPGLGLGLHISKKLVELHHGKIWVESRPLKGNIFAFSLPTLNRVMEETR